MKKVLVLILVLMLNIFLIACTITDQTDSGEVVQQPTQVTQNNHEEEINSLVEEFGRRLQQVSLLAPEEVLEDSMRKSYGEFVSPTLLEQWLKDPLKAPGRLTSSPWPDRIEILSTEKISEGAYEVKGEIIEITGASDEIVEKKPITLVVEKVDGKWLINNACIGDGSV